MSAAMNTAAEKIEQYLQLEQELWALVGEEVHYSGLEDGSNCKFYLDEQYHSLEYLTNDGVYGGELRCFWVGDDYTIAVYDNGCGKRDCVYLFKNENRSKEALEEEEDD